MMSRRRRRAKQITLRGIIVVVAVGCFIVLLVELARDQSRTHKSGSPAHATAAVP